MLGAAVLICALMTSSLERGREFLERGDTAAALYWFEIANQENPRDADAWRYAGAAYERLRRYPEAVNAFHQSLALASDAATYSALSRAYMALGRWDEAAAAEEQALKLTTPLPEEGWYTRTAYRVSDSSVEVANSISETATRSSQSFASVVTSRAKATARSFKRAFWK